MAGALLLVALAVQTPQIIHDPAAEPNPFADFETRFLANGLKVWYKRLPDDPVVSVSVTLPFGRDSDPRGKEQLAHFTEHMLFSDHLGRSEEEIKREIEVLGGVYNASVSADRTFYFVRIGAEHGLFAIDWLYRIISPHAMDPEIVDGQREPVALEVRARPRQLTDWIWAYYLNPTWLRLPDFWQREFGMETLNSRDYYPYASLNRIEAADLRWFYDTYYTPSTMTLTVIGDLAAAPVMAKIEETFAKLPARPDPTPSPPLRDPQRYRQTIAWSYRSNVFYSNRFKFYDLTTGQDVMLIFVGRLLRKRLNDRLRFGQRKATYGIRTGTIRRDAAAYLLVSGGIKASEFAFARDVIEAEIDALRTGTLSQEDFAADREAVANQLRVTSSSAENLESWVRSAFYRPDRHVAFPDLLAAFETVTLDEVRQFAQANLTRERQVVTIFYPHPIPQALLLALAIALVWVTERLAARSLTRPIDMSRIRYVARFRVPGPYLIVAIALLFAGIAGAGRLLVYGYQVAVDRFLLSIASFWIQWPIYAAMLGLIVFLFVLALSRLPRKILLFDDQVLIKYLSYRSVAIGAGDIREVREGRFKEIWLSRALWRCLPLTFGIMRPGIYLEGSNGRSYFFSVRRPGELLAALEKIRSTA